MSQCVSEVDIIRTIVRTSIENLDIADSAIKNKIYFDNKAMFESLASSSLEIAKAQSKLLIPYIKEIINRQQRRNVPTIIEGAGIIPSMYFPNNHPL